jgi:hypothetical protein
VDGSNQETIVGFAGDDSRPAVTAADEEFPRG